MPALGIELTYEGPVIGPTLSIDKYTTNMARLLPKTRACLAKAKVNYQNCLILMTGDSTTRGLGANNAGSGNSVPWAIPANVAIALQASGYPGAEWNSWMGSGASVNDLGYDTRIVVGTSWARATTYHTSIGGFPMFATAAGTALAFTPTDRNGATIQTDTCVFYYIKDSGAGSVSFDINGGAATTVATAGTNAIATTTVTAAKGNNTCNANWVSGTVYVLGMDAYDSTLGAHISVVNAGWLGATSTNWADATTPTSPRNAIASSAIAASLISIDLGINDWVVSTGTGNFQTNIQNIITSGLTTSDVMIITPNPTNESEFSQGVQLAYVSILRLLAVTDNLAITDVFAREGSWGIPAAGSMNTLGLVFDGHHPDRAGYEDISLPIISSVKGGRS